VRGRYLAGIRGPGRSQEDIDSDIEMAAARPNRDHRPEKPARPGPSRAELDFEHPLPGPCCMPPHMPRPLSQRPAASEGEEVGEGERG
jgi:hypothetical protein